MKQVEVYQRGVTQSFVIQDILSDEYSFKEPKSHQNTFITSLNNLIKEHETKNPFDKLEPAQKELFILVEEKLGEHYANIKPQIDKMADQLHDKNQLVDTYLANSEISFWVSSSGLFLAIISIFLQWFPVFKEWQSKRKIEKELADVS
jgi:hypothetical protein